MKTRARRQPCGCHGFPPASPERVPLCDPSAPVGHDHVARVGAIPLPLAWARQIRLTAASEAAQQAAMALTDQAAAMFDQPGAGRLVDELMRLSEQLRNESGQLAADAGDLLPGTPPRRWRGDPPDVDPFPPQSGDLRALQRWTGEWQCREGRLAPRSARERAIAATGERARQTIAEAPPPPPARQVEDNPITVSRRVVQRGLD